MSLAIALRSRRVWIGGALLSAGLLTGPLMPQRAAASIGYCRTDPIVMLSDGARLHLQTTIGDDPSDVQQVSYTVHAPVGTIMNTVVYTGGALKNKEYVSLVADDVAGSYDTTTTVSTASSNVRITAATFMPGYGSGSVSGQSGDTLTVHIGD